MTTSNDFRMERDLLGEKKIPAEAYYGVQTLRAMENFHISGVPISQYPDLIRALAIIKLAAARANVDCGAFDKKSLDGIDGACVGQEPQERRDGRGGATTHATEIASRQCAAGRIR